MRKHKGIISIVITAVMAVCLAALAACSDKPATKPSATFVIDKSHVELTVDGNLEVLTLTIANVNDAPVWKSSNDKVATVSVGSSANKATVKPVGKGYATVYAMAGENIAVCTVKVNPGVNLELLTPTLEIMSGRTARIDVETDAEALFFKSNNTNVATVSQDGLVSAISGGTARITVSGGGKSVVCNVTVIEPTVKLDKDLVLLTLDDGLNTYKLNAESNGKVEWHSLDPDIATVDDGLITAVSKGETTVVASYESAEARCTVKVKDEILTVSLSENEHSLPLGETFTLSAAISPEQSGADAGVEWSVVEGSDIVSVDEQGNVTADGGKYGTAIVRATSVKDSDCFADCTVTVPDPYGDWLVISDKASLEAALRHGNENKNMYLDCDIDLGGETIKSDIGMFNGTFEGRGYKISNFNCGSIFGGVGASGKITRLAITCVADKVGSNNGVFGLEMLGTIENCRIDVTFGTAQFQALFGRNGGAQASIVNTVAFVRNPSDTAYTYAGFVQSTGGTRMRGTYYALYGGTINSGGLTTLKTEEQLRSSALYDGYDKDIWIIEDGELPELANEKTQARVRIELDKKSIAAYVGDTAELIATVKPDSLGEQEKAVRWSSSDESVATVENGVVTLHKVGKAVITVTLANNSDVSAFCSVTVESATEITLSSARDVSLEIGETSQIEAVVNRGGLTYKSSDEAVASVSSDGRIKAIKAGETEITVRSTASIGKFETVRVTVLPKPELTLVGEKSVSLEIGAIFTAEINSNRDDDVLSWSSSDTAVATVDDSGKITAIKAGNAVIYCTSGLDATQSVEIDVTVLPEIEIELIEEFAIQLGLETPLNAYVNRGGLTYKSSDESIVTVSSDGILTGVKEGNAQITVTSAVNPQKTAVCNVSVQTEVEVSVSLNKSSANLDFGESITLKAVVNVPGITWSSSDESVATVTQDGVVTALNKNGVATVTATSVADSTVSAQCEITVEYVNPVITLKKPHADNIELEIGGEIEVEYTVSKGGADIIIDGGEGVLTLDGNLLTAASEGVVTVKIVSDEKSEIFESFTVTVYKAPVIIVTNAEEAQKGLFVGDGLTLDISINRNDGEEEWSSSDETVLTIADGVITTHKEGTATVTVTFTTRLGATASASVQITVREHASVSFKHDARSVKLNGSYTAEITFKGGTASFSSKNPAIASVDANGRIRGVALGKTVITATVGEVSDFIIIEVYRNSGETEISSAEGMRNLSMTGKYVIVNDIDFDGVEITNGYVSANFQGAIDGRGYSLKNIKTNFTAAEQGMFGMLNGMALLKNMRFVDFVLGGTSAFTHGGLIRQIDGIGSVKDCYFEGVITARGNFVGPIGSKFGNGSIQNCIFNVTVQNAAASGTSNPRLAVARWFGGEVKNCYVVKTCNAFAAGNGDNNAEKYASALKTEEQLKDASLYNSTWNIGWIIEDGKLPQLRSPYVDEPLNVKLDKNEAELFVGENLTLSAIVTPEGLSDDEKAVEWSSSDEEILTVDGGVVRALKSGTATVTIRSVLEPDKTASCEVTVKAIVITIDTAITELKLGATKQLEAIVNRGEYTWESSDDQVATVDGNGLVEAVGAGNVVITVRSTLDATVTAEVSIEVKSKVEISVILSSSELALDRDDKATLKATVVNSDGGVTWSSSDESIATVDADGNVTTHGIDGTAVITATAKEDDGSGNYAEASCTVTVEYVQVTISASGESELEMQNGATIDVSSLVTVSKGGISVTINDGDGVISIEDGVITALSDGTATVRIASDIDYDDYPAPYIEITVTVFTPAVEMFMTSSRYSTGLTAATLGVKLDPMPDSAKAGDIVWSSSDSTIVSAITGGFANGIYTARFTPKKYGFVTITATYEYGGRTYSASCEVEVFNPDGAKAVSTVAELKTALSTANGKFYLACDIDFAGTEYTTSFTGTVVSVTLDGRGYALKNIKTKFNANDIGFINMLDGTTVLKNIAFVGFDIGGSTTFMYGGLIGSMTASGCLKDCYFEGIISARRSNESYVGTIGTIHTATAKVENCIFNIGFGDAALDKNNANANPKVMVGRWFNGEITAFVNGDAIGDGKVLLASLNGAEKYAAGKKTEAQLMSAQTYDDSWSAWLIEDGAMPRLRTGWDA